MENSAKNDIGTAENAQSGKASGKKKIIAAAAVLCVIAICVCVAAALKPITVKLAERDALNNDFEKAYQKVVSIESEKAEMLCEYLRLRMEINENYPTLLVEYNPELITQWLGATTVIIESDCGLNSEIISEVYSIRGKLAAISGTGSEYLTLRESILSLMDIFAEYNRLHTKTNGENVEFTVDGELAKLEEWRGQYEMLLDFSNRRLGESNTYLLNYLLRETEGELDELRDAMDTIVASGYSSSAAIRYSDNIQQKYPDITNREGESVNLLDKQKYESYMYEGICTGLVTLLAEFYIVKG